MIIGKDFVILSMPKTGTEFRQWLARQYNYERLCSDRLKETKLDKYIFASISAGSRLAKGVFNSRSRSKIITHKILLYLNRCPEQLYIGPLKHGGVNEMSGIYTLKGKEMLSALRHPYRQMVSGYQYKKRHRRLERKPRDLKTQVMDIDPRELTRVMQRHYGIDHIDYPLGRISHHFIRMYFKDPVKILSMSAEAFEEYCISDEYKEDMYPIKFFRTETMNRQLCEYLKSKAYLDSQIIDEIFKEAKPKNVSNKKEDAVWDEETKAYFEKTEKFYIRMVKELAPLPEDDF